MFSSKQPDAAVDFRAMPLPETPESVGDGRDRRIAPRFDLYEPAELLIRSSAVYTQVLNISSSGATVRIPSRIIPARESEVTIRFVDNQYCWGNVVWLSGSTIGIRFGHPLGNVEELLWREKRGSELLQRLQSLQSRYRMGALPILGLSQCSVGGLK